MGLGISPFFCGLLRLPQSGCPAGLGARGARHRRRHRARRCASAGRRCSRSLGLGGLGASGRSAPRCGRSRSSRPWSTAIADRRHGAARRRCSCSSAATAARIWLVGALTATALAVAGDTLVRMLGSDAASLFVAGRLDGPLGYINGQASFYLLALWPCIALAEQRRWPALSGARPRRGASLLASLLVLSQSRGVALAALVSAILVARRGAGPCCGARGRSWCSPPRLPRAARRCSTSTSRAGRAAVPADVSSAAATAALLAAARRRPSCGASSAWAAKRSRGRRGAASARRRRRAHRRRCRRRRLSRSRPATGSRGRSTSSTRPSSAWGSSRRAPASRRRAASTRLASGAGNRYDYWRIAWGTFRDRPVLGVGAGNYDRPYFERRATTEDVRQPHSVELQALSELGLVGARSCSRVRRRARRRARIGSPAWRAAPPSARFLAVAATGAVAAWLVHTSVDWIHLLPGVTGVALAFAAVLLMRRQPRQPTRRGGAAGRPSAAPALRLGARRRDGARRRRRQPEPAGPGRALPAVRAARARGAAGRRAARRRSLASARPGGGRRATTSSRPRWRGSTSRAPRARALLSAAEREPHDFVTWALLGDLAVRTRRSGRGAKRAYGRAIAAQSTRCRPPRGSSATRPRPPRAASVVGCESARAQSDLRRLLCLALLVPRAAAQSDGVFVDPDSPTGKQYQLPLESARRQADPGGDGRLRLRDARPRGPLRPLRRGHRHGRAALGQAIERQWLRRQVEAGSDDRAVGSASATRTPPRRPVQAAVSRTRGARGRHRLDAADRRRRWAGAADRRPGRPCAAPPLDGLSAPSTAESARPGPLDRRTSPSSEAVHPARSSAHPRTPADAPARERGCGASAAPRNGA